MQKVALKFPRADVALVILGLLNLDFDYRVVERDTVAVFVAEDKLDLVLHHFNMLKDFGHDITLIDVERF